MSRTQINPSPGNRAVPGWRGARCEVWSGAPLGPFAMALRGGGFDSVRRGARGPVRPHQLHRPKDGPARKHAAKGARPCCAALEKRKRKLGVHSYSYSLWIVILSSNDSNGFTSFKIICFKAAVLNTVSRVALLCTRSASLSQYSE